MSWEMFFLFQDMWVFFHSSFIYLFKKLCVKKNNYEFRFKFWTLNVAEKQHWEKNTVQIICKVMKYSKMQLHGNVCVHQMSLIFILKIKDYFSSNKAGVTTYICLFICTIYITESHYIIYYIFLEKIFSLLHCS